jgi:hypothetical protein
VNARTAILAAAAGALFLAGQATPSLAAEEDGKIKCEGVNACKGHSDCSTATNECSGQNSCKGKGFVMMTPEECKAAKDKLAKEG